MVRMHFVVAESECPMIEAYRSRIVVEFVANDRLVDFVTVVDLERKCEIVRKFFVVDLVADCQL